MQWVRVTPVSLLIILVAACGDSDNPNHTAVGAVESQSVTMYIGPKVDHPGKSPADADEAAGIGSVTVSPKISDREVTIQARPIGGSSWKDIKSEKLGDDGWVYFNAKTNKEYRAKYEKYGSHIAVKSDPQTYNWNLAFDEQFNGSAINTDVWSLRGADYSPKSHRSCSKGDWSAITVAGGVAMVQAFLDPNAPADATCPAGRFVNGHIGTENSFSFTSGWAAARVKFHVFPGSHAAFWVTNGYTKGNAEVDVAEYFSKSLSLKANVYWDWNDDGEYSKWQNDIANKFDSDIAWDAGFHVFSVRWKTPDANGDGGYYQFYVDNQKVLTRTSAKGGVASNPEKLILSMLTNDGEAYDFRSYYIRNTMEVDWVRVWADNPASPAPALSDDPPAPGTGSGVPGSDGVHAIQRHGASGTTEVHVLSGEASFQSFSAQIATALHPTDNALWEHGIGRFDDDPKHDLYAINRHGASGQTEVHVLTGGSNFQTFGMHAASALHATDGAYADLFDFAIGDFNGDGRDDVYAITRQGASGMTEVHVVDAASDFQSFSLHVASVLGPSTGKLWEFAAGDCNADGRDDLYAILRRGASGTTELHVLDAATNFQTFLLQTATPLHPTDGSETDVFDFALGDFDQDRRADLYAIKRVGGSGMTELHVLGAANNFQSWLAQQASTLHSTTGNLWSFAAGRY